MDTEPNWFASALESGETDRVNDAIDRIDATEPAQRVTVYEDLFDACRPVYDNDDGYVRQSVVRFLREAYPRLEIRLGASTADSVDGLTLEDVAEHRAQLVEFLLRALEDDDGRVRRAAVDGIETISTALSIAELDAEQQALREELEALHSDPELSEQNRKHVEQARQVVDRQGLHTLLSGLELSEDEIDSA